MPYRKIVFGSSEIYHIFNRSVARVPIFVTLNDCRRLLDLLNYYRFNPDLSFSHFNRLNKEAKKQYLDSLQKKAPIVDIFTFCLMPNHYHILLRQLIDGGIKIFMTNMQNSYAKYFNVRHDRSGSLFQAMFKGVRIETEEQLMHVSRYIHLNPSTSFLIEPQNLLLYPWSSLPDYIHGSVSDFINTEFILNLIGDQEKYKDFLFDQVSYQRELNNIKHLCLE